MADDDCSCQVSVITRMSSCSSMMLRHSISALPPSDCALMQWRHIYSAPIDQPMCRLAWRRSKSNHDIYDRIFISNVWTQSTPPERRDVTRHTYRRNHKSLLQLIWSSVSENNAKQTLENDTKTQLKCVRDSRRSATPQVESSVVKHYFEGLKNDRPHFCVA